MKQKIKTISFSTMYTFLDYVFGGCELSLMIAIDFTKSNGSQDDPKSLHYAKDKNNEYIEAIRAVGDILIYYDSDKKIPLLGFGAKIPPLYDRVCHCFSLTGNIFEPSACGIEEIIDKYFDTLSKISFHGPTHFSEIITFINNCAQTTPVDNNSQKYFILLILTDGDADDMEQTKEAIIKASKLPISIIIVGLGDNNFTKMQVLDNDDENMRVESKFTKELSERDVVQFVPYRKYRHEEGILEEETLKEVPEQFMKYMVKHHIKPKNRKDETEPASKKITVDPSLTLIEPAESKFFIQKFQEMYNDLIKMKFPEEAVRNLLSKEKLPALDKLLAIDILISQGVTVEIPKSGSGQDAQNMQRHSLYEEKKKKVLLQKEICLACARGKSCYAVLNCRHLVLCEDCGKKYKKKECPMCKLPIDKLVRLYQIAKKEIICFQRGKRNR